MKRLFNFAFLFGLLALLAGCTAPLTVTATTDAPITATAGRFGLCLNRPTVVTFRIQGTSNITAATARLLANSTSGATAVLSSQPNQLSISQGAGEVLVRWTVPALNNILGAGLSFDNLDLAPQAIVITPVPNAPSPIIRLEVTTALAPQGFQSPVLPTATCN